MKLTLRCAVLLMVLTGLTAIPNHPPAAEALTLYDDFQASRISPDKWFGYEGEASSSHPVLLETLRGLQKLETLAETKDRRLHLMARARACTECGDSGTYYGKTSLKALKLQGATTLQTKVRVNSVEVSDNGSINTEAALARARLQGFFFNDGSSTGSNDATGDVVSWIGVQRTSSSNDAESVLEVRAKASRCTDSGCYGEDILGEITLGTVEVGADVTLKIQWVKDQKKFIFRYTSRGITNKKFISCRAFKTVNSPALDQRRLEAYCEVPPSSTGTPRPTAFIDVYFDNVKYQ